MPENSMFKTVFYMAFNFASSVGIITVNKLVFKEFGFNYPNALTALHFVCTFLGLLVCNLFGMFTIKQVNLSHIIPLSLSFTGFVVFNNLSLQLNSLGFYQLFKVLTTPGVVIIQLVAFGVPLHNYLKLALVPICIGVCIATVSDMDANFWGTLWASVGVVSTSFYQIWVKSKQLDLGLDSYQLLFLQAPSSAVLVLLLSLASESWVGADGLLNYPYDAASITAIVGSAILSFAVNLSIFLVIGSTSPTSYNVLGHFKLVCILATGFLFFNEAATTQKVTGAVLTACGVIVYTTLQQNLKNGWEAREKTAALQQAANASPEPSSPLSPGSSPVPDVENQGSPDAKVEAVPLLNRDQK